MTEQFFTLTPEQVELLGLDRGRWFAILNGGPEEWTTVVTSDETTFDSLKEAIESEVIPPREFAEWVAAGFVEIPGAPGDW